MRMYLSLSERETIRFQPSLSQKCSVNTSIFPEHTNVFLSVACFKYHWASDADAVWLILRSSSMTNSRKIETTSGSSLMKKQLVVANVNIKQMPQDASFTYKISDLHVCHELRVLP